MDETQNTIGEAAEILGVPVPSLKTWHRLGYFDWTRFSGDEDLRRRWMRFLPEEVVLIGIMLEFARLGVGPKLAATVADRVRPAIFLDSPNDRLNYICIAHSAGLYAVNCGPLGSLTLLENWKRVFWMTADGKPATKKPELRIPAAMVLVDGADVRKRIDAAIENRDTAK